MLGVPGRGSLIQGPVLVKVGGQGVQNGNTEWENVPSHLPGAQPGVTSK